MQKIKKTIIWKTSFASYQIASVRYRCILPAIALKNYGYESAIMHREEVLDRFDKVCAVVFVKTFSKFDLILAQKAHKNGVPIYIDLCDNIFTIKDIGNPIYENFQDIASLASAVITTGSEMTKVIAANLIKSVSIIEIPDQVEANLNHKTLVKEVRLLREHYLFWVGKIYSQKYAFLYNIKYTFLESPIVSFLIRIKNGFLKLLEHRKFRKDYFFDNKIKKLPKEFLDAEAKTIIWFGNAGSEKANFGISNLKCIINDLIEVNKKISIKLLVVSNNYELYLKLIKPLPILSAYKSWSYSSIFNDLSGSDLCVIPNSQNDFSLCKSPNRTLLALSLGVPVVATNIPSLSKVVDCIITDNWQEGIYIYLNNQNRVQADIAKARRILEENYSVDIIGGLWHKLLSGKNEI